MADSNRLGVCSALFAAISQSEVCSNLVGSMPTKLYLIGIEVTCLK